ncbi:MAG: glutamine synthetase type III, partial [Clostridia bacterium]|nr:glutamine synthetase type III [Clostridia bacterium]
DLNRELWKLGILAKTEHNEVAPAQHELAPVFTTTNISTDHNQMTMEIMKNVAKKHNLVCLLHEKPFAGVNGSGKHNNWSISSDTGENLLEPGETPAQNARFLTFLCAVIKAVDDYQDLLRISAASAGNDHRLGANEAPPAVVSMFLGDELTEVLRSIEKGEPRGSRQKELFKVGVHILPRFPKDSTDRNRTSPFAFTGNKFEFRMPGSAQSVAGINTVLNTVVAESLRQFADELEGAEDFDEKLDALIKRQIKDHKRIIFNGNGYDDSWLIEAEKRGLLNLRSTPDAIPYLLHKKNIELFTSHGVFTEEELRSRYEIKLENYSKLINIEALTMIDMARKDILPAVSSFAASIAAAAQVKKSVLPDAACSYENETLKKLTVLTDDVYKKTCELEEALIGAADFTDSAELAMYYKTAVLSVMCELRISADELETVTSAEYWPYPSYGELLFGVR